MDALKTTKIQITIFEKLALATLSLPVPGNFLLHKITDDLIKKLEFSQEDMKKYSFNVSEGSVSYKIEPKDSDDVFELEITEFEKAIIFKCFDDLNAADIFSKIHYTCSLKLEYDYKPIPKK